MKKIKEGVNKVVITPIEGVTFEKKCLPIKSSAQSFKIVDKIFYDN